MPTMRPPDSEDLDAGPPRLDPSVLGIDPDVTQAVAAAFDPRRLTLGRHRSGWTKRRLAGAIGVTPTAVSQYERGHARPSASALSRIAVHLGLPVPYFAAGRPLTTVGPVDAHFRSLRDTRAAEREQALATVAHLVELATVLERVVRLPSLDMPAPSTRSTIPRGSEPPSADVGILAADGPGDDRPEVAARELRRTWRLSPGPLPHLVRHIERHGVIVAMARFSASDRIDAFSCWPSTLRRPVMVLTRYYRNVLRRRYSAAHELGHLLLHRQAKPGSAGNEREADRFAAELLMPADDIAPVLPTRLDLAQLVELQQQWGVSVQALLRRCHDLATVGPNTYQRGMIAIRRLGWSHDEPTAPYTGEWPAMLAEALDLAGTRGLTEQILADGMKLPVTDIRELLGLARDERPQLHLVATDQ